MKCTSRDVMTEEFKTRLEYFIDSCEKIHDWNMKDKYWMEFTFYADWHPDEFEEITTTKQRYSEVITPIPSTVLLLSCLQQLKSPLSDALNGSL